MSNDTVTKRPAYTNVEDSTAEDWKVIMDEFKIYKAQLPDRVLDHLRLLGGDYGGFPIDRLSHCLQTATRAYRDGRDEEYVVCCLLHDIGDTLGSFNHPDIAAAILKPFVNGENLWMVEKHGIFQAYYFFEKIGLDPNIREQYKDHPLYGYTVEFCAKYDAPSFDADYENLSLEFFEPMVKRVFATPKNTIYKPKEKSQA